MGVPSIPIRPRAPMTHSAQPRMAPALQSCAAPVPKSCASPTSTASGRAEYVVLSLASSLRPKRPAPRPKEQRARGAPIWCPRVPLHRAAPTRTNCSAFQMTCVCGVLLGAPGTTAAPGCRLSARWHVPGAHRQIYVSAVRALPQRKLNAFPSFATTAQSASGPTTP